MSSGGGRRGRTCVRDGRRIPARSPAEAAGLTSALGVPASPVSRASSADDDVLAVRALQHLLQEEIHMSTALDTSSATASWDRFRALLDAHRADCVQQREAALAECAQSVPDPVAQ